MITLKSLSAFNVSEKDYNEACEKLVRHYNGSLSNGVCEIKCIENRSNFEIYKFDSSSKYIRKSNVKDIKDVEFCKYLILKDNNDKFILLYNASLIHEDWLINWNSEENKTVETIYANFKVSITCETLDKVMMLIDSKAIENSINENLESIINIK